MNNTTLWRLKQNKQGVTEEISVGINVNKN